ncbi:MAG TPA: carotenoid biosynthesis protein [Oscillatoriaceae cyanobacterium M33_DOE_052]|uniref:Carotenoid biosynthesis protein n=1 Tax=Planktothricoides sp. SpSt-374 TaxID=2282167 RepID=A0A7C3ZZW3_9CYAN|nr:carotenoid biosynthesis protein [Oscillatoriaceae cyanobacterium M33_DOE_052]
MKQLVTAQRGFLIAHIVSMAFGLAGLLLVVPNADTIVSLSPIGQQIFQVSMANGGVAYILFGAVAVSIYAGRLLGVRQWLAFMVPAVFLSLGSELLGTSTGFPFGHYQYLSGLGYKISGLVPFTIPLSWFYLGLVSYLLARVGLETTKLPPWGRHLGAIVLGALLLTSWDFVLDPAMSQTDIPFWEWLQPGAFFGMPYQNFAGWMGTGALFMTVAALLWPKPPLTMTRGEMVFPVIVYASNFIFSAVMSLAAGLWIPVLLGIVLGMGPAIILWAMASPTPATEMPLHEDATPHAKASEVAAS